MKNQESKNTLPYPFCKKKRGGSYDDDDDDDGEGVSSGMRDGKCSNCGAWMDSYGIIHKAKCPGGFHDDEKCPVK
jgi:hypothetical protein